MSTPLLTTKLHIPPVRPELVSRPRLIERLSAGLHRKLILVSAPAGFGKTTLISELLARVERPATLLSLDSGDNDLSRFLTYVIAALRQIDAGLGRTIGQISPVQRPFSRRSTYWRGRWRAGSP